MRYLTDIRTVFWCLVLAVVAMVAAVTGGVLGVIGSRQAKEATEQAEEALAVSRALTALTALEARPRLTIRPVAIPRAETFLRVTTEGNALRLEMLFEVVNWGDAEAREMAMSGPLQIDGGPLVRRATGQVDLGAREPLKSGQVRAATLWVTLVPVEGGARILPTLEDDIRNGRWQAQIQMLVSYRGAGSSARLYRTSCVSRIASERASLEFEQVE